MSHTDHAADAMRYAFDGWLGEKLRDHRTTIMRAMMDNVKFGVGITRIDPNDFLKGNTMDIHEAIDHACIALENSAVAYPHAGKAKLNAAKVLRAYYAGERPLPKFNANQPVRCVGDESEVVILTTVARGIFPIRGHVGNSAALHAWRNDGEHESISGLNLVNVDPRDAVVKAARMLVMVRQKSESVGASLGNRPERPISPDSALGKLKAALDGL